MIVWQQNTASAYRVVYYIFRVCYFWPESKKNLNKPKKQIKTVVSEFTMALIWVTGKLGQALFTFLSICCCTFRAKIDTRLHVKYVANSLKVIPKLLQGTRRFGDMMMTTATTAIIVEETMYVGPRMWARLLGFLTNTLWCLYLKYHEMHCSSKQ